MNSMQDQFRVGFVLSLFVCLVIGCGGGTKKAPAPVVQNANPAAPAPIAPATPGNGGGANVAATGGKSKSVKTPEGTEAADVEPPGPDDYVLSSDQIVTEIEDPKPKLPPPAFDVTPLPKGFDSTNLVIVSATDGTPAGSNAVAGSFPMPSVPQVGVAATAPGAVATSKPMPANPNQAASTGAAASSTDAWTLPKGFTAIPGSLIDPETGLPRQIRAERDPVEMVLVPPGVFLRGADVSDATVSPRHTVLLEHPYYIDTVEVSVARYNAFREYFRKNEGRKLDGSANHDGNPDFPAVG
ncbi:MAG: hypothetical protein JWM11_2951, partial [Planctomycetaceae bacterium]|nr:hypothetical protein [Planctomycetaceae bacterium]